MDHLAELLILMTDDLKGGDESQAPRSPWKEFWELNGTFIQVPGHKVEGITHVHLCHSKVIIISVFLRACSEAMNYTFSVPEGQATPN